MGLRERLKGLSAAQAEPAAPTPAPGATPRRARLRAEILAQEPYVGTPRVAVLTVARDEADMLPRWVGYYGAQFGPENLIVIDDNSTDGGTDDLPCTVHRIPGFPPGRFEASRIRLVSGLARGLLASYDVVIFTDTDEFIVPDPAVHEGLLDFLTAKPQPLAHAAYALNVVHHRESEAALDPGRPVLGQRHYAKFAKVMCKPSIKRVPAAWRAASHGIAAPYVPDPELWMFHLKFADYEGLQRRAEQRNAGMLVDGRGKNSSWSRSADEITGILDHLFDGVDLAGVPEFATTRDPSTLVIHPNDQVWRAPKQGQLQALANRPVVKIPERFYGLV